MVLAMAAFTTLVEAGSSAGWLPGVQVGRLELSLSVVPALGLAVACGDRLLGRSSLRRMATWFWIVSAAALWVFGLLYVVRGDGSLYLSLVVAALGEELVFRLAAPAAFAFVLVVAGIAENRARIWGLVAAGVWFFLLPGHQDQLDSVGAVAALVCLTALSAFLVYRSGSVLPMAAAHAVSNLATVLLWKDAIPPDIRGVTVAVVLTLLTLAYSRPRRLTLDDERGLVDTRTGLNAVEWHDSGHVIDVVLSDGRKIRQPTGPNHRIALPPN
jgi:hypothetical protein